MKALTKKLGPLPAWAWAAIVVGVVGFFWLRSKANAQPTTPSTNDQPTQASGAAPGPNDSGSTGNPAGLDPNLLQALSDQNSTMLQALLNAFQSGYGGGNYGAATGSPYATATPTGASTSSGATTTPLAQAFLGSTANPFTNSAGQPIGALVTSPGFSAPKPLGGTVSPGFSAPTSTPAPAPSQVHVPGAQVG